jgi:serine/threonine protein kinase
LYIILAAILKSRTISSLFGFVVKLDDFVDIKIVMQFCDLGSLSSYLKIKPFQEAEIAVICKQALNALSFLHSFGVVHRYLS